MPSGIGKIVGSTGKSQSMKINNMLTNTWVIIDFYLLAKLIIINQ